MAWVPGKSLETCFVAVLFGGNLLASIVSDRVLQVINFTPFGLYKQVLKMDVEWADIWRTCGISLVWIVIICGIGLWRFQKTELK